MLLRRITQHIQAQNWFAVLLDFFIVVFGVFIGIQVANWNAVQGDIKIANASVDRIQEDLSSNRVSLKLWLEQYEMLRVHAVDTLGWLNHPVEEQSLQFVSDAFLATSFAQFTLPREAYNDLLSLGAPKGLVDKDIRQYLARYYFFLDAMAINLQHVPAYRSRVRSIMPYDVQNKIRADCSPQINIFEFSFSLAETCQPDLSEDQIKRAVTELSAVDLKPDLNLTLNDLTLKIGILRLVLNASQELDDFIENNK